MIDIKREYFYSLLHKKLTLCCLYSIMLYINKNTNIVFEIKEENYMKENFENMWLKISTHDERYDFNLEVSTVQGTLEQVIEDDSFMDLEEMSKYQNNYFVWSQENRHQRFDEYFYTENIKKYFEVVNFHTIILIPFKELLKDDFFLTHGVVSRNKKYGFYDIKGM